jgi:hypothetical protein
MAKMSISVVIHKNGIFENRNDSVSRPMRAVVGHGWRCFVITLAASVFLHAVAVHGASFGGREFRRIWTDGNVPSGASKGVSAHDVVLARSGAYFRSNFDPQGIYFIDNIGAITVANKEQDAFSSAMNWLFLGFLSEEEILLCPVTFNNILPCHAYGRSGLVAVTEPTPEQAIGQYVDGRMVYTTISGSEGVRVWLYTKGQGVQLLLDNSSMPDLNGHIEYDGETFLFTTGSVDVDATVWVYRADGTTKQVLRNGDPLPGSAGTYRGLPTRQGSFVDQGRVYIVAESRENLPIWPDHVLLASDGDTTEVILKRGQEVPGLSGVTLDGFNVARVRDGRIWFSASLSNGTKAIFLLSDDTWTQVVSTQDQLDGRAPVALGTFRDAVRGDDLVFQASFLNPNFTLSNELYTNADLPGFTTTQPPTGAPVNIALGQDNNWRLTTTAQPGNTYSLQSSFSLDVWEAFGEPIVATETVELEWTVPRGNGPAFFRVEVDTP